MTSRTGSFGRAVALAAVAALVLVLPAATANEFSLTVVSQTTSTITFSYPAQTGYGYLYSANGTVVSRTNDPSRTSVKFSKASSYEVAALVKGPSGSYPVAPPPQPVATVTQTIVNGSTVAGTVSWRAVYDGNADGTEDDPGTIRFFVDGSQVLSETTPPFGDTSGFWDSTIVPNASHTFRVDAVSDAGVLLATNQVSATVNNQTQPPPSGGFPNDSNTGTPAGVTLHTCASPITTGGTYDSCQFNNGLQIRASNVTVTRSRVNGQVDTSTGQTGAVIQDTTVACGCPSTSDNSTPVGVFANNVRLTRVNVFGSGHGIAVESNVILEDSYVHGLGGNTEAHKDGLYVGDGHNVIVRHNNIDCDADNGCTAAIGILTDFSEVYDWTIDGNLLNTKSGSYCLYGSGGPQKPYGSHNITATNNHFGRRWQQNCGYYGPVTYWDSSKPGMVWSNNVWDDTGELVAPEY